MDRDGDFEGFRGSHIRKIAALRPMTKGAGQRRRCVSRSNANIAGLGCSRRSFPASSFRSATRKSQIRSLRR